MTSGIDSKSLGVTGSSGGGLLKEVNTNKNDLKSDKSFLDTLTQKNLNNEKIGDGKTTVPSVDKPILKFSNHALERMNTRGIHFSPDQITKIEQGMQKASSKGSREALVLTDDLALIVSLKNSTVVTVMDKSMLKENVFTNIDSTVFV